MKLEGKTLAIVLGILLIVGILLGWLIKSALVPKDSVNETTTTSSSSQSQQFNSSINSSGLSTITTKIIKDTVFIKDTVYVQELEVKTYLDTLSKKGVFVEKLLHNNKSYDVKYDIKVPHETVVYPDGHSQWFGEVLSSITLPIIKDSVKIKTVTIKSEPVLISKPWYLNEFFYSTIVAVGLLILSLF